MALGPTWWEEDDEPQAATPLAQATPQADEEERRIYREIIAADTATQTQPTRGAVINSYGTSPDRAARIKQIERQTGLPYELIDRNFDALDKKTAVEQVPFDKIQQQSPTVAKWATEPGHAAIAKDDFDNLGFLEWLFTAWDDISAQKLHQDRAAVLRSREIEQGALTRDELEQLEIHERAAGFGGRLGVPTDAWFLNPRRLVAGLNRLHTQVVETAVAAGPVAGTAYVAGGILGGIGGFMTAGPPGAIVGAQATAAAGLSLFGTLGAARFNYQVASGNALQEYTSPDWTDQFGKPMDRGVARNAAMVTGMLEAGLENFQMGWLVDSFPALRELKGKLAREAVKEVFRRPTMRQAVTDMLKGYVGTLSKEVLTEVAQRSSALAAGELAKWVEDNGARLRTPGEWGTELLQEAEGALSEFALGLGVGSAQSLARDVRRAKVADANAAIFDALAAGAADSKTLARAPEAFQKFVAEATKDGPIEHVYLDHETFTEYFQSPGAGAAAAAVTPEALAAELTGDPNALAHARTTGEALKIPTAAYAAKLAATEHHAALAAELRIGSPDAMNARQSRDFREALKQRQQDLATQQREGTAEAPILVTTRELLTQIGVRENVADVYARLFNAGFTSLALRAKLDPQVVFQRYGLAFERPGYPRAGGRPGGGAPGPSGPAAPTAPAGGPPAAPGAEPGATPTSGPEAAEAAPAGPGEVPGDTGLPSEAGVAPPADVDGVLPGEGGPDRTATEPGVESAGAAAADAADAAATDGPPADAGGGADVSGAPAESLAADDLGLQPGAGAAADLGEGALALLPPSTRGVFTELHADAVAHGYTGTDVDLAQQFLEQYERARLIAADLESIAEDHSWRALLVEVSKAGGIGKEKGAGEIAWMMESLATGSGIITKSGRHRVKRQGQRMPLNSVGLKGGDGLPAAPGIFVRKGGLSLDGMREHLQQDPRWQHLDSINDLLVILENAVINGYKENTGQPIVGVGAAPSLWSTLEGLLEVKVGEKWWQDREALDPAGEALIRFDVGEFFQRLFGLPLLDLVDEVAAQEAAAEQARALEPPPAPTVPAPLVLMPAPGSIPPVGQMPTRAAYDASLRATYFDAAGAPRTEGSRVVPQTAAIPPVGTWMVDDRVALQDGHELEHLVEVQIDALEVTEDTGPDRFADVARYARWILEGLEPPPIRVLQSDQGTLKTLDHRRLLAAKAVGATTIKAWVSWATVSPREGHPVVGLTAELAAQGAGPLTVVAPRQDRTVFPDDARRLEALATELAAAGVPTADVLDTGEVQPRLPGAEDVREQEQATPTMEAPFSLTGEVARSTGRQDSLFQRPVDTVAWMGEHQDEVQQFSQALRAAFPALTDLALTAMSDGTLYVEGMVVDPAQQNQGIGTQVVQRILAFADARGWTVSLTPAAKGYAGTTTSAARLRQFYSRFGFVANVGATRDTRIDARMYRPPPAAPPRDPRFTQAIALYLSRGAGQSPVRMAQALKDVGYRFGPMTTQAARREALALVNALIADAEDPGGEAVAQAETELYQRTPPMLAIAPARYQNGGRFVISPRVPFSTNPEVRDDLLTITLAALREPAAEKGKAVQRYANYVRTKLPLLSDADLAATKGDDWATINRAVDRMVENLVWLWKQMPKATRDRAKLWYQGAHTVAGQLAVQYEREHRQVAAVMAVLSPRKDWFINLDLGRRALAVVDVLERSNARLGKRIFDHYERRQAESYAESTTNAAELKAKLAVLKAERKEYEGKRWDKLDDFGRALFVRSYDEMHIDQTYPVVTPEGPNAGLKLKEDGEPGVITWATMAAIAKAMSVLRNGSEANINRQVGYEHKVRSFYNNISDPDSADFATIDTHAIAAAMLLPLSLKDPIVEAVMGGNPMSAPAGLSGTNVIFHEAYLRGAKVVGALPREFQSVTWEVVRGLFEPDQKRGKQGERLRTAIDALSAEYRGGIIDRDAYLERLLTTVAGNKGVAAARAIRPPDWSTTPPGLPAHQSVLSASDVWWRRQPGVSARRRGEARRAARLGGKTSAEPDRILGDGADQPAGEVELFQTAPPGPVGPPRPAFYSRLVRAVTDTPMQSATGYKWKGVIRKWATATPTPTLGASFTEGISQDELALAGVDDLENGRTYTKQQVLDYLTLSKIQVHEVTLGVPLDDDTVWQLAQRLQDQREEQAREQAEPPEFELDLGRVNIVHVEEEESGFEGYVLSIDGQEVGTYDTEGEAEEALFAQEDAARDELEREWWNEWEREQRQAYGDEEAFADAEEILQDERPAGERGAIFEQFTLPGAVEGSYRELFLTAPAPGQVFDPAKVEVRRTRQSTTQGSVQLVYDGELLEQGQRFGDTIALNAAGVYEGRPDSYWIEVARKSVTREARLAGQWADGHEDYWMIPNPIIRLRYDFRFAANGDYILFLNEIQPPHEDQQARMPDLYRRHGYKLGLKTALKIAVENGARAVAWTTGQMQVDLYPTIETEVRSLEWESGDGAKSVSIIPTRRNARTYHMRIDDAGVVQVVSPYTDRWTGVKLETIIGKELADQVLAAPEGNLEGEGLRVGGKGLRRLYDTDLGNVANDLPVMRQAGAKVGTVTLPAPPLLPRAMRWRTRLRGGAEWVVYQGENINQPAAVFAHYKEAHDDADARNARERETLRPPVPGIQVTPALREAVLGGQAYFQVGDPATPASPHDGGELAQPQPQGRPAGAKGSLRFDPAKRGAGQRDLTLSLFADHDLSTVIHEAAHLFMEVMQDLALQSPELAADLAVLKAWAADPNATGPLLSEYQHEQIARAFEAYVLEGKAPSVELRGIFGRMRAWMLNIYRTVKGIPGLDRQINNEVRAVFDRLLASDEAIAEARQTGHVVPLFLTPEAAGTSATEWALYRKTVEAASQKAREEVDQELLHDVQREQTDTWRERREEVRPQVEAEVNATPVYQALAAMQKGQTPEGEPLVPAAVDAATGQPIVPAPPSPPLRLSRQIVSARFGQDMVKRLPRTILTSKDGGLDPDVVATQFGFTSGDHLLQAVLDSPPRTELIEEETDRRMQELYPALLGDDVALLEAAQAALSDESREKVIRAELRALAKLARAARPFQRAAAAQARTEQREAAKERAYERRWFEAEAKLRVAIAEGAKQAEIDALADELARLRGQARSGAVTIRGAIPDASVFRAAAVARIAATRVRDLVPQLFWTAATTASKKATEHAARQEFDAAIAAKHQELLNLALYREARRVKQDIEQRLRKVREGNRTAARQRLGKAGQTYLEQWDGVLERFEFAIVPRKTLARRANIVKWIEAMEGEGLPVDLPATLIDEALRTNYTELTIDEFVEVTDGLQQIVHLSRLKNRLLKNKQQRDLAALVADLQTSILDNVRRAHRAPRADRRPKDERRRWYGDFFGSHRKLANLLRELDGWQDGGPMVSAIMFPLNAAAARESEMQATAAQSLHALIERTFPGRKNQQFYEDQYIPAVGRTLSRMERITVALNWGNDGNRDRVRRGFGWNEAQVQAVLDTLTSRELEFVQGVFDYLNTYWPEIAAKSQRVTGMPPVRVEAVEIRAANGTIAGGYYPLKYDDRKSAAAIMALDLEAASLAKPAAFTQAVTKHGHEKARAETVELPVRLDFGVLFTHVAEVIHDLSHHETLIDVGRILGHRQVQQTILDAYGDQFFRQLRNAVKDIAFGPVPAANGTERALNHFRLGATVAGLGWSFVTSFLQPAGLFNSAVQIGPKWVILGLGKWVRNVVTQVQTVKWIEEQSPMMRDRARTRERDINEIRDRFGVSTGKLVGWVDAAIETVSLDTLDRQAIADSYFAMIQQAQRLVDIPTWLGMYEKQLAAGESEERAVQMADQAVLDSQGGGQIKDLAQVQRGTPAMKMWTTFYSYFNVVHNQAVEAHRRSGKHPLQLGRELCDYTMIFILPATTSFFIHELLRPKDDEPEELALRLLWENISYAMGTLVGFREIPGAVSSIMGYEGPAGARIFSSLGKLGREVYQMEADAGLYRAVADVSGVILQLPAGQATRSAAGIAAIAEGEVEGVWPSIRAVIAGPPPK